MPCCRPAHWRDQLPEGRDRLAMSFSRAAECCRHRSSANAPADPLDKRGAHSHSCRQRRLICSGSTASAVAAAAYQQVGSKRGESDAGAARKCSRIVSGSGQIYGSWLTEYLSRNCASEAYFQKRQARVHAVVQLLQCMMDVGH